MGKGFYKEFRGLEMKCSSIRIIASEVEGVSFHEVPGGKGERSLLYDEYKNQFDSGKIAPSTTEM